MSEISARKFLSEFKMIINDCGGEQEAADYFGVSRSFVNSVSGGNTLPGKKILKKMGLEPIKEIRYRYKRVK